MVKPVSGCLGGGELSELRPQQVRLTSVIELGAESFVDLQGGRASCICECICECICDCICDCICEVDMGTFRSPVTAVYEVVYEPAAEVRESFTGQLKESRLLIEMDPHLAEASEQRQNLEKLEKLEDGRVRFALKRTVGRRRG